MEDKRPSRQQINTQIALLISQRGTCARLQVGAVATQNNRIVATGYNGPSPGEPHCSEKHCDTDKPCERSIHAEDNLIRAAKVENIDLRGATIYCTHQPCMDCSTKILRAGIEVVYYIHPYRIEDGLHNLIKNGVTVYQINDEGIYTRRQSLGLGENQEKG